MNTPDHTHSTHLVAGALTAFVVLAAPLQAEVIEFRDKDEWIAAVGDYTTIDFTGYTHGERITDQYRDLGVLFTDCYVTFDFFWGAYPNDGWGVDGNSGIHLEFDEPQLWLATDFPGVMQFELYSEGELIYAGLEFGDWFVGLLSDIAFDEVLIYEDVPGGNVNVDDLHFGVPAPGALPLIAMTFLLNGRRRA